MSRKEGQGKGIRQIGRPSDSEGRTLDSGDNAIDLRSVDGNFNEVAADRAKLLTSAQYVGFTVTHEFVRSGPDRGADLDAWYKVFPPDLGPTMLTAGGLFYAGLPPVVAFKRATEEVSQGYLRRSRDFTSKLWEALNEVWPGADNHDEQVWDAAVAAGAAAGIAASQPNLSASEAAVVIFREQRLPDMPPEAWSVWQAGVCKRICEIKTMDARPDPSLRAVLRAAADQWLSDKSSYAADIDLPAEMANPELAGRDFINLATRCIASACLPNGDTRAQKIMVERAAVAASDEANRLFDQVDGEIRKPTDLPREAFFVFDQLVRARRRFLVFERANTDNL